MELLLQVYIQLSDIRNLSPLKPPTVKTAGFPHLQAGTWRGLGLHCSRRTPADISPETDGQSFRHSLVHGFAWLSSILRTQLSEMTKAQRLRLPYSQPKEWFLPPVLVYKLLGNLRLLLFQHKISGKNQAVPVLTGNLMRFLESKACRIWFSGCFHFRYQVILHFYKVIK